MSTITLPLTQREIGKIRPLNIMRDLSKVADLVALCFKHNMDAEGQRYVQHMRDASRNRRFLNWASNSLPLTGYVWEDQKKIVGNISLVPFRKPGKTIFLLANIAVHPDYRRKGIARLLTEEGMNYAHQRKAESIWLQVEEENLGAVKLYENLGFRTRARRTVWNATSDLRSHQLSEKSQITAKTARFWPQHYHWLNQSYPEEIRWYRMPDWENFKPGIKYWLYKLFVENDIRQWAVEKDGKLQAALIWTHRNGRRSPLWLASTPQPDTESLAALLLHARLHLYSQRKELYIDYPAGELAEAFELAGFTPRRTLLWMRTNEPV